MRILVYPGTFDPVTRGHLDIIRRAAALCDRLYIAVLSNSQKKPVFSAAERVEMIQDCLTFANHCVVESYDGLLVDYVRTREAAAVVRGLRSESDFRFALDMFTANRMLMPSYETLLLPCRADFALTSSSIVREVTAYGGDLRGMLPEAIRERVAERLVREEHRLRYEAQLKHGEDGQDNGCLSGQRE